MWPPSEIFFCTNLLLLHPRTTKTDSLNLEQVQELLKELPNSELVQVLEREAKPQKDGIGLHCKLLEHQCRLLLSVSTEYRSSSIRVGAEYAPVHDAGNTSKMNLLQRIVLVPQKN